MAVSPEAAKSAIRNPPIHVVRLRSKMHSLRFFTALAGLVAVPACASVDSIIIAEPDVAFSLPVGKTAGIAGSTTRLTFRQVREDSRCPTNVVCVWEGDAKIELLPVRDGAAGQGVILSLHTPNEAQVGDLFVRFVGLTPYPATPEPSSPRQYVAELVIRRL